jgi:hypothetical protein
MDGIITGRLKEFRFLEKTARRVAGARDTCGDFLDRVSLAGRLGGAYRTGYCAPVIVAGSDNNPS